MKKILAILTTVALTTTIASAELVGSLHIDTNQDTNNVDRLAGFQTRVGTQLQKGSVQGEFSFLAGVDIGVGGGTPYEGMQVKTFTSKTHFLNLDRYAGSNPRGILVWDFDLSGLATNAWELKVDYEGRRTGDPIPDEWYISFNGMGRTLDTTDVTNLTTGAGSALVQDALKYVKIGELPVGVASAVNTWDLTDIINTAITNGGNVRLVYHCDGYFDDIIIQSDTGLIAADTTAGDPVEVPEIRFLIDDDFSMGAGSKAQSGTIFGDWLSEGPENKDYNTNNTAGAGSAVDATGMLVIQDVNGDEKGNGEHKGFFDNVVSAFEGVALTNDGDWLQLTLDASIMAGNWTNGVTPVLKNSNEGLRIGLTEAEQNVAATNSGYGLYIPTGDNSSVSIREMKKASAAQSINYGTVLSYDAPDDGTMLPILLKLERVAGGDIEISGSYNLNAFETVTATNGAINDNIFDTFALSVAGFDQVLKIDNVTVATSVPGVPPLSSYEQWAVDSGLTNGIDGTTDNPDLDELDNFGEYVFGGDPTNGADIGVLPSLGTGGYVYSLRNDTALTASILTRTDLVSGDWTTNAADPILVGDGGMGSYTNGVGTNEVQQFYKLLVE